MNEATTALAAPTDPNVERARRFAEALRTIAYVVENNPTPEFLDAMEYGLNTITSPVGAHEGARNRIVVAAQAFIAAGIEVHEYSDPSSGGVRVTIGPTTVTIYANRSALGAEPVPATPPPYKPLLG